MSLGDQNIDPDFSADADGAEEFADGDAAPMADDAKAHGDAGINTSFSRALAAVQPNATRGGNGHSSDSPFAGYADSNDALRQAVRMPAEQTRRDFYYRLHRAMRGRYLISLLLGLLLAGGLAYATYRLVPPTYRGEGIVEISRDVEPILHPGPENQPLFDIDAYIESQTMLMTSDQMIDLALQEPEWQNTHRGDSDETQQQFVKHLLVEHPLHSEVIKITFMDRDKNVAAAGVNAVIHAYQSSYSQLGLQKNDAKVKALSDENEDILRQIRESKQHIDDVAKDGGDDLEGVYKNQLDTVAKIEARATDAELALSMMQKELTAKEAAQQLTVNQIGMLDATMHSKLDLAEKLEQEVDMNRARMGPQHPLVLGGEQQLAAMRRDIDRYADEYRDLQVRLAANPNAMRRGGLDLLVESADSIRQQRDAIDRLLTSAKERLAEIGRNRYEVEKAKTNITALRERQQEIQSRLAQIQMEDKNVSRMRVSTSIPPKFPYKKLGLQLAGATGLFGLLLPFCLLAAFGLYTRRYRYSLDAEENIGSMPLLGILPTLPQMLTDPEQAAVAAHCIHQIRIMLQLSHGGTSKAFMFTSASTGDGKTSLTMALALSFSASGSRTLVIDCDVVGQGLTHRLRVGPSGGLLQSMLAGTMRGRFKRTTTPNLWILPVGSSDPSMAGSFSPAAVARVIDEARQNFDVVLIDTGPILGSLEAHAVARTVDGVVLTVSRGQQQPLVDRAVNQLRLLGANICGLVFNRAEKRDFQRSVMSTSIRSVSQTPVTARPLVTGEPSRFGPLATSVMSFIPERKAAGSEKKRGQAQGSRGTNGHPVEAAAEKAEDTTTPVAQTDLNEAQQPE